MISLWIRRLLFATFYPLTVFFWSLVALAMLLATIIVWIPDGYWYWDPLFDFPEWPI